jgi:hypothetical protein
MRSFLFISVHGDQGLQGVVAEDVNDFRRRVAHVMRIITTRSYRAERARLRHGA